MGNLQQPVETLYPYPCGVQCSQVWVWVQQIIPGGYLCHALVDMEATGSILRGCILLPLIDKQWFLMSSSEFLWIPGTLSPRNSLHLHGFYWKSSWIGMNQEEAFHGTLAGPLFLLNSWRIPNRIPAYQLMVIKCNPQELNLWPPCQQESTYKPILPLS